MFLSAFSCKSLNAKRSAESCQMLRSTLQQTYFVGLSRQPAELRCRNLLESDESSATATDFGISGMKVSQYSAVVDNQSRN